MRGGGCKGHLHTLLLCLYSCVSAEIERALKHNHHTAKLKSSHSKPHPPPTHPEVNHTHHPLTLKKCTPMMAKMRTIKASRKKMLAMALKEENRPFTTS